MVALSVSISSSSSPRLILSPSFLSHLAIVPSSIVSLRRGMVISAIALFLSTIHFWLIGKSQVLPFFTFQDLVNGFDKMFSAGESRQFQRLGIRQRHFQTAHPQDRRVQIIEGFFLKGRRHFG